MLLFWCSVGFVGAAESNRSFMESPIPSIVALGSKEKYDCSSSGHAILYQYRKEMDDYQRFVVPNNCGEGNGTIWIYTKSMEKNKRVHHWNFGATAQTAAAISMILKSRYRRESYSFTYDRCLK